MGTAQKVLQVSWIFWELWGLVQVPEGILKRKGAALLLLQEQGEA